MEIYNMVNKETCRAMGTNYWYRATYNMCGRICSGYGATYERAIKNCLSDMRLVAILGL